MHLRWLWYIEQVGLGRSMQACDVIECEARYTFIQSLSGTSTPATTMYTIFTSCMTVVDSFFWNPSWKEPTAPEPAEI